jgi:hypothetical protein
MTEFEPWLPEFRLKAEPPGGPLRRCPGAQDDNGENNKNLTPKNTGSGHGWLQSLQG